MTSFYKFDFKNQIFKVDANRKIILRYSIPRTGQDNNFDIYHILGRAPLYLEARFPQNGSSFCCIPDNDSKVEILS